MFQCRCNQDLFISCNAVVPPRSPSQLQPPSPAPACSDGGLITHPGSSTTLEAHHACAGRSWTASQCIAGRPQHCRPWHNRSSMAPAPGMAGLRSGIGIRIRIRIGDGRQKRNHNQSQSPLQQEPQDRSEWGKAFTPIFPDAHPSQMSDHIEAGIRWLLERMQSMDELKESDIQKTVPCYILLCRIASGGSSITPPPAAHFFASASAVRCQLIRNSALPMPDGRTLAET